MDTPQSNDEIHAQLGDNASGIAIGKEITQNVTQHFYNYPATPTTPPVDFAAVEQRYREQVVRHYNKLALTGLPERDPGLHEIALEHIFIKLNIELPQPAGSDFLGVDGKRHSSGSFYSVYDGKYLPPGENSGINDKDERELRLRELERRRPEPITLSVAEALHRHKQLTIIGGPGSGKTTLTRWLAVIFARREQAKAENLGVALAEDRLPIMLELRRFAERFSALSQQPTVPDLAAEIASFISQHAYYPETPAAFIQQALIDGRCLILLDGLDEIADLGARQTLTEVIQAFLQHPVQRYRDNLLLVTSRPHGYQSISLGAFQECEVKPFTADDVANFIRHWYATAYRDEEQSEAADLIAAIQANQRVGELATNPLLCTIIAIVYRNNRVLPNRRVELYLKCCEALLDTWERNKALKQSGLIGGYDWQTKLELLAPVAYWLHSEAERLAAPEEDFVKQLALVLRAQKLGDPAKAEQEARGFIKLIRDRSGLLQGRGDGTLEFTHRTFQEYLSARYIATQRSPEYIDLVMVHLHKAWWREVHLLVIGYLGSSHDRAPQVARLMTQMLSVYPPPHPLLRAHLPKALVPLGMLGRLWPSAQWQRRLAWVQERELEVAVRACLDCTPLGVPQSTLLQLQQRQLQFVLRLAYAGLPTDELDRQVMLLCDLLQRSANSTPIIEKLIALLTAAEWSVRYTAIQILSELGRSTPNVILSLLAALTVSNRDMRVAAARTLGQLGQSTPTILAALLTARTSPDWSVRAAAISALGQLGQNTSTVLSALLNAFTDVEVNVRYAATLALGQLGQSTPVVLSTLLAAFTDPEQFIRYAAVQALSELGQNAPTVLSSLLNALTDSKRSVREAAVRALDNLGQNTSTVLSSLLTVLTDPEANVRAAAARALGNLGQSTPTILSALLTALADPHEDVRAATARALGNLGQNEPTVLSALLTALTDPEVNVQAASARALGDLGQSTLSVLSALLTALTDQHEVVQAAAAEALGKLDQSTLSVLSALLTALTDQHEVVRAAAAEALGKLDQSTLSVLSALLTALTDPKWSVREASAQALGRLKIENSDQLRRVLIALNRRAHASNNNERGTILATSRNLVEGRPLPGYHWTPIRERQARRQRLKRFSWWAGAVCVLVLAALVVVYLAARLDADNLLVRFGAAVALITGLAAGVAQVLGWTLRNPYGKHEP